MTTSTEAALEATGKDFLHKPFSEAQLVLGLVGAVGAELEKVRSILEDRLKVIGYSVTQIRVTKDIIPGIIATVLNGNSDEYVRIKALMDTGNARGRTKE